MSRILKLSFGRVADRLIKSVQPGGVLMELRRDI